MSIALIKKWLAAEGEIEKLHKRDLMMLERGAAQWAAKNDDPEFLAERKARLEASIAKSQAEVASLNSKITVVKPE